MIDDKFLKSVLDSQKALQSYTDTAKAASLAIHPMMEKLRILEENSPVQQMMKDLERQEASMRLVCGPMWRDDLERVRERMSNIDSSFIRAAEEARQAVASFESRFRLPEMPEIGRLIREFKANSISEALTMHAEEAAKLQSAMESMNTPWLDCQKTISSIAGFAQLQGIGYELRRMSAFDENLTASLRINLGDWRDPITWRPEIFTGLTARSDFYASLGFNRTLTDFPTLAFEQGLDLAGLRPDPLPFVDRYKLTILSPSVEDEGYSRTTMAHNRLLRFETQLRAFIDEQMTMAFGAGWPKHRLPNGMYDQWQAKQREAQQADAKEWPLIAYADFTDYAQLICRRDNWREAFMKFFERPESVRESFQRLYPIRVATMHARLITREDELFLRVETLRLEKVFIRKKKLN